VEDGERVEINVKEQEAQDLHCAVCREPFGHWSAVCEDCGTHLHFACRGLVGRCPTLGCPQSLVAPQRARAERPPGPRLARTLDRLRNLGWRRAVFYQLIGTTVLLASLALFAPTLYLVSGTAAPATRARADMKALSDAVKLYRLQTQRQPRYLEDLRRRPPQVHGWQGPYIGRWNRDAFRDPWGTPYVYRPYGGYAFELLSYGPDGAPGGEDDLLQREGFPKSEVHW
jgi:general secretion pathway protein G